MANLQRVSTQSDKAESGARSGARRAPQRKTHAELMRAKVLRERRFKLNLKDYTPLEKSIRGRVAEFLVHCAEHYPHSIITYEEITQAIFMLGKTPDARSPHVKSVRNQMSSASALLLQKYERTLITSKGVGVRASVNSLDVVHKSVGVAAARHAATGRVLVEVCKVIDVDAARGEIADTSGDPVLRQELLDILEWYESTVVKYAKTLDKPKTQQALALPPPRGMRDDEA